MSYSPVRRSLWLLAVLGLLAGSEARSDEAGRGELDKALRALETARLRLRLFERVDYPLRLQQISSQIQLTQAEIESYRRRVAEYERFDGSKAVFISLENCRLLLRAAELRLQELQQEQLLLQLHFRDEQRLRQLLVDAEAQRVQTLAGAR